MLWLTYLQNYFATTENEMIKILIIERFQKNDLSLETMS